MIVGIDLGTKKSAIGYFDNQKPIIIPDYTGHLSIPSLVLITPDEKIYAGNKAANHRLRYNSNNITISSIKRLLGRHGETGWSWWKTYPQEVSAFILTELKLQAEKYLNCMVTDAIIAIPSHFDDNQRRATREAAEIAGLHVKRLLNEATSAAITYGFLNKRAERILVFDLGGGTLDISIVEIGDDVYEVKCTEGESSLGGDDFDNIIVNFIISNVQNRYGEEFKPNNLQTVILKESAEKAKIELSSSQEALIYIPGFLPVNKSYIDLNLTISRDKFEELAAPLFKKAGALLNKAIRSSGRESARLNSVLLLGGSSRIPAIRALVKKHLHMEPFTGVDPEICVAQGAALMAGVLQGNTKDLLLLDAVPSTYGIGLKDDVFSPIVVKNTTVPTKASRTFTTTEDSQKRIEIDIYQGEHATTSENTFVTHIELGDIPPAPKGIPQIEITFDINPNMIMQVIAKDLGTDKEQRVFVQSPFGLNDAQKKVMKKKLDMWIEACELLEIKPEAESIVYEINKIISRNISALDDNEILSLKEAALKINNLLQSQEGLKRLQNELPIYRPLIVSAQQKIYFFQSAVNNINILIDKIEILQKEKSLHHNPQLDLLDQGKDLLKDYLHRSLPVESLENIYYSVRYQYEELLATDIFERLGKINKSLTDSICSINLKLDFKTFKEIIFNICQSSEAVSFVIYIDKEKPEYMPEIHKKVLAKLNDNEVLASLYVLLLSFKPDITAMNTVSAFPNDAIAERLLAIALLNGLNAKTNMDTKKVIVDKIAKYLPSKYFDETVPFFLNDENAIWSSCFVQLLQKQPAGNISAFLKAADTSTKLQISKNKYFISRIIEEMDEDSQLFAIQSVESYPENDTTPFYIKLFSNSNDKIRYYGFKSFFNNFGKHADFNKMVNIALSDPSENIKLAALEEIKKRADISFFDPVISFIESTDISTIIKKSSIAILGKFNHRKAYLYLLKVYLSNIFNLGSLAYDILIRNIDSSDTPINKLTTIAIRKINKNKLHILDLYILSKIERKHPDTREVIAVLKK